MRALKCLDGPPLSCALPLLCHLLGLLRDTSSPPAPAPVAGASQPSFTYSMRGPASILVLCVSSACRRRLMNSVKDSFFLISSF
ncbi:unnamed protein product [Gadus morhua 'NCC']